MVTSFITSITKPTRTGWTFNGYYTSTSGGAMLINSSGSITASDTYYSSDGTKTIYAQWKANNPAYYDSAGGYWYVENGRFPQSRVEDETLRTYLKENWSSLDNGSSYTFGPIGELPSKVYNGKEYYYCYLNNNYYLVEPIRWRLEFNENQASGYGVVSEEGVMAVMDTIVYAGRFSVNEISENKGYSNTAVGNLYGEYQQENNQIDSTYLKEWTESMPTFGRSSLYGDEESITKRVFVSSIEEIERVTGSRKVKFSDFVYDFMVKHKGVVPLCLTRDLGSNYNNILCLNGNGDITQRKPNLIINQLGVQFTIKVTEYACI